MDFLDFQFVESKSHFTPTDTKSSDDAPKNLFHNPGFEDPLVKSNWNCLGELNHGSGGIMSRTIKYKRSGKYAGVCHSRIGFWAGPGQFIGEPCFIYSLFLKNLITRL